MDMGDKIKRAVYFTLCIVFLVSVMLLGQEYNTGNKPHRALSGVLDLNEWNPEAEATIKLDGEWEFYWNKLFGPEDFKISGHAQVSGGIQKTGYIDMPCRWDENRTIGNTVISKYGGATMRLVIKNVDPEKLYAVKIPYMFTAYKLWANGVLIAQSGKVGLVRDEVVPEYKSVTTAIPNSGTQTELVLQVANFDHRKSSSWSMEYGPSEKIFSEKYNSMVQEAFLFGATLIMGFYFMETYFARKKDKASLYFAVFCFLIALRTLMVGERIFTMMFPGLGWHAFQKIAYISMYLSPAAFTLYIKELFPLKISKKFSYIMLFMCSVFSFIVLVTNHKIYDATLIYFEIMTAAFIIYLLWALIDAMVSKEEGARTIFLSFIFFSITIMNDMLFTSQYIGTKYLIPVGVFVLIVCQTFILTKRFSDSFTKNEELLKKNCELVDELEKEKDALCTEMSSRMTAEKLLDEAVQYDKIKNDFFANISHEFRTPLNVILSSIQMCELIMSKGNIDVIKLSKYIGIMKQNSFRLLKLVNNLIDITKIDAGYYKLELHNYNIVSVVEEVTMSVAEYIRDKGIELVFDTDVEEKVIACDPEKIERIILNLLSNAVKFTDPGGRILVSVNTDFESVKISVKDTGIGIAEDNLEKVFERFVQVDQSLSRRHEGSGIGLALVKSLVEMHGGKIQVLSKKGSGSEFVFTLPARIIIDEEDYSDKLIEEAFDLERITVEFSDIY